MGTEQTIRKAGIQNYRPESPYNLLKGAKNGIRCQSPSGFFFPSLWPIRQFLLAEDGSSANNNLPTITMTIPWYFTLKTTNNRQANQKRMMFRGISQLINTSRAIILSGKNRQVELMESVLLTAISPSILFPFSQISFRYRTTYLVYTSQLTSNIVNFSVIGAPT